MIERRAAHGAGSESEKWKRAHVMLLAIVALARPLRISASRPQEHDASAVGMSSISVEAKHLELLGSNKGNHSRRLGSRRRSFDDPASLASDQAMDRVNKKAELPAGTRIGVTWKTGKVLGSGSFGGIYEVTSAERGVDHPVCMKVDLPGAKTRLDLGKEASMLQDVQGPGIPKFYEYMDNSGMTGESRRYLVMQKLGLDLEQYRKKCGGTMSETVVLRLARQMIKRFQQIHKAQVVYKDTKPNNFMLGWDAEKQQFTDTVYLIDFGLSGTFWDSLWKMHLPQTGPHGQLAGFAGTQRYASMNAFKRFQLGRKDDMETLGYVWSHLLTGALPWAGLQPPKRVGLSKEAAKIEMFGTQLKHREKVVANDWTYQKTNGGIVQMLPPVLKAYMADVMSLQHTQEPVYDGHIASIDEALRHAGEDVHEGFVRDDGSLKC